MHALSEFLKQYNLASWVLSFLLALYILVELFSDFETLKKMLAWILGSGKSIRNFVLRKEKNYYERQLSTTEYLKWQLGALQKIYAPLIEKLQEQGYDIDFVRLTWLKENTNGEPQYEAVRLKNGAENKWPFEQLLPESGLCLKKPLEKESGKVSTRQYCSELWDKCTATEQARIKRYERLMSTAVRHANRIGYMLDEITFSEDKKEIKEFSTHSGFYMSNILESHIMEFELFHLYKKYRHSLKVDINKFTREELLENLPIRKCIHEAFKMEGDESRILISGKFRNTLLGVQIFVLLRNKSGSYDVACIRRSKDVVAKPGFLQYIPSGGFEAANDRDDIDTQRANYSIHKILFRELAEECFGIYENMDWDKASAEKIYFLGPIKQLNAMLKDDKAQMEFLGTTMNLAGLRHELSFILKIEMEEFVENFVCNYESTSTMSLIDIRKLEKTDYWYEKDKHNDLEMLNCTSAGLLELARGNHLYQEALYAERK